MKPITIKPDKPPENKAERLFFNMMKKDGWDVTRKGWPDYICFKDGELAIVEIKPKSTHRLKGRQQQVMEILSTYGIRCYRWSPNSGFIRILKMK